MFRQMLLFVAAAVIALPIGCRASGAILRVNPSATGMGDGSTWADGYTSIQAALAASSSGDTLWVRAGTYKPSVEWIGGQGQSKTFAIPAGRKVYGGFAGSESLLSQRNPLVNITILSGDIDDDDALNNTNAWHVVRIQTIANEIGDETQLDGFVITLGYADGNSPYDSIGGGLLVVEAQPIIQNCIFINNHADAGGGGIGMYGENTATVPPTPETDPQFRACRFLGNDTDDDGGGAFVLNGDATFINCEFGGNSAGSSGGGLFVADDAGGVDTPSTALVINCTFANNSGNGRSIYNGDVLVARNSVAWDAGATTGHVVTSSDPAASTTITNSNIEGDSSTTNADPAYVSETGDDATAGSMDDNLRLSCGSPSIDQGDQGDLLADDYDVDDDANSSEATPTLARSTRVLQAEVDQGCYETFTLTARRTSMATTWLTLMTSTP